MTIKFYKSEPPYGYLNNFWKAPMFIYGRWWKNVEAPYQAQKTTDENEFHAIWVTKSPRIARDLGQLVKMRSDWNDVKIHTMYECVLAKFVQNHDLRELLLSTRDEHIVEDSPVDSFWGCGKDGNGLNHLGETLMRVRLELKKWTRNE